MAKRGKKPSKQRARTAITVRERVERLEKALGAGLKREAKAASRLEAAQIEVAVLRMALAEVIGEANEAPPAVVVAEVPEPPAPAAQVRAATPQPAP